MAKSVRQVDPWVSNDGNGFGFASGDMNYFAESLTCINSEVYQREYMPYSYMTINKKGRHVLNWLTRNPWVWQKENFCEFNPMGKLGHDKTSIIPCQGKVNLRVCTDEFLESCFDQLIEWRQSGQKEMTPELREIMMTVYREYAMAINEGARIVGLLGGFFEQDQIDELFDGKDESSLAPFKSTLGVCNGVFAEARLLAEKEGLGCLNDQSIFKNLEISEDTCLLTEESILKIVDRVKKISRSKGGKMKTLVSKKKIRATRRGQSVTLHTLFHVSPFLWESVEQIHTTRCDSAFNPQCRIKQVEVGTGAEMEMGYMIDNIILINTPEVLELEECIDKRILFAYLTFSGNFQLGGSFVDSRGAGNLGMRIIDEAATSNAQGNVITITSHALFSGTILNKELVVGAQTVVEV